MALWDIAVVDGIVALTDADGDAWDSFNGLPDPYVTMEVVGSYGETLVSHDTVFPVWDETVLVGVNSTQLEGGLDVSVVDSDLVFDTTIATCVPDDIPYNSVVTWSCSTEDDYELWSVTASVMPSEG